MDPLTLFVPLTKADASQRLVYGQFDETPDRAGEICDYATAKPAFEAWSAELSKASDGKSLGNIRGQHNPKIAAGKLVEINYDDMAKTIGFVAKIVDDQEWKKVDEGVYTGFSPGGKYAKRWQDGAHKRYTPLVHELSIVDVPCNPNAGFTMVKADGSEEEIEFVLAKAYEPGNEATKARSEDLAKAAGDDAKPKDFVVQARSELIAENAAAELAKVSAEASEEPETEASADDKPNPLEVLDAALAKGDAAIAGVGIDTGDKPDIFASAPFAAPSDASVKVIGADLAKSFDAVEGIRTAVEPLQKSLYSIVDVAQQLRSFRWIVDEVVCDAKYTDRASELPQLAVDIIRTMKTFLIAMVEEEVAYLLTSTKEWAETSTIANVIEIDIGDDGLAKSIIELVAANAELMEKAGGRNSQNDATTIQSMHDGSVEAGATCAAAAEKADGLAAENDRLSKALTDTAPKVEALAKTIETLTADRASDREVMAKLRIELDEMAKRAAPGKGVVLTHSKEADGARGEESLKKSGDDAPSMDVIRAMPVAQRVPALEAYAQNERATTPA